MEIVKNLRPAVYPRQWRECGQHNNIVVNCFLRH